MRSHNSFNKIWILESLADGELKTGTRLYEELFPRIKATHQQLIVAIEKPASREEFVSCLKSILTDIEENKNYPLIHLECHGSEVGLGLSSGEIIEWIEIRDLLIRINFACEVNLLVVVAACKGVYLAKAATQLDRAPFYAMVGSKTEMTAGEIQADFTEFYMSFFESLDGNTAIESLNKQAAMTNRSYYFVGAEVIFFKAFRYYHQNYCVGKAKRRRLERLVSQALSSRPIRQKGVNWARKQAKLWFRNEQEPAFERMKAKFFGITEYPNNAERFTVSYADIFRSPP